MCTIACGSFSFFITCGRVHVHMTIRSEIWRELKGCSANLILNPDSSNLWFCALWFSFIMRFVSANVFMNILEGFQFYLCTYVWEKEKNLALLFAVVSNRRSVCSWQTQVSRLAAGDFPMAAISTQNLIDRFAAAPPIDLQGGTLLDVKQVCAVLVFKNML